MGNWLNGPWLGKIVGGLLGLAIKGPIGALVGVILGHQFDRGLRDLDKARKNQTTSGLNARNEQLFFFTTFAVMGHLAKSDGRVSEQEIAAASKVMEGWALNANQVNLAVKYFTQGKQPGFQLASALEQFKSAAGAHRPTLLKFVEALLQVMLADHQIHPATRERTWQICQVLGVTRVEMASIEEQLRGRTNAGQATGAIVSMQGAYEALKLEESASDQAVKVAYRRMMNRYHPDKLVDSELSKVDLAKAKDTLERCREAYKLIKSARGFR